MTGYGDFCGTARAAEILATRWTPLVVRNMLFGCRTFHEIRDGLPGISPTVLTDRLRMLERAGVLCRVLGRDGRVSYELTASGEDLGGVIRAMNAWGEAWIGLDEAHYRAPTALWRLSRLLPVTGLPEDRVLVRFDIGDDDRRHLWLSVAGRRRLLTSQGVQQSPGAVVTTSAEWVTKWVLGLLPLVEGRARGLIDVSGPPALQRLLSSWDGAGAWPDPGARGAPAGAGGLSDERVSVTVAVV